MDTQTKRKARKLFDKLGVDEDFVDIALGVFESLGSNGKQKKLPKHEEPEEVDPEELPDDFLIEIPIMIPACLARRGNINIFPDEIDLFDAIKESIIAWRDGCLDLVVFFDEEDEEGGVLDPGIDNRVLVVEGTR